MRVTRRFSAHIEPVLRSIQPDQPACTTFTNFMHMENVLPVSTLKSLSTALKKSIRWINLPLPFVL